MVSDAVEDERRLIAVREYAAEVLGWSSERIVGLSRFEAGNRHAVYKVAYLDGDGAAGDVVVRVCFDAGPDESAQAEREATALRVSTSLAQGWRDVY